jgi:hypothetical protein
MIQSKTYGLQNETRQYLRRLYAYGRELAPTDVADIDNFVKGLKQLNLWHNMVCWPMRSIHNIGSGSTVLSLGGSGIYNGSIINTLTWSTSGLQSPGGSISYVRVDNYPLMAAEATSFGELFLTGGLNFRFYTLIQLSSPNTFGTGRHYIGCFTNSAATQATVFAQARNLPTSFDIKALSSPFIYNVNTRAWIGGGLRGNLASGSLVLNSTDYSGNTTGAGVLPFTTINTEIYLLRPQDPAFTYQSSFVGTCNKFLNSTDLFILRDLYKQTIGKGLNLP